VEVQVGDEVAHGQLGAGASVEGCLDVGVAVQDPAPEFVDRARREHR
jgi:hypothetical protein